MKTVSNSKSEFILYRNSLPLVRPYTFIIILINRFIPRHFRTNFGRCTTITTRVLNDTQIYHHRYDVHLLARNHPLLLAWSFCTASIAMSLIFRTRAPKQRYQILSTARNSLKKKFETFACTYTYTPKIRPERLLTLAGSLTIS